MSTKITIHEQDGKIELHINPPLSFPDFLQLQLSTIGSVMTSTLRAAESDPNYQEIKDDMYFMLNVAAGNLLDRFDPNPTKHFATELTAQAIMEAENKIIDRKYKALPKDKAKAKTKTKTKVIPIKKGLK
jgi:hypothetical protein